jgi:hypothetical protein
MPLPIPPNVTFEVEDSLAIPPAYTGPHRGYLRSDYRRSLEMGEGETAEDFRYTHTLDCELSVDVRDEYDAGVTSGIIFRVFVPDRTGTEFEVLFVARIDRGSALDRKRCYLRRKGPAWPTEDI